MTQTQTKTCTNPECPVGVPQDFNDFYEDSRCRDGRKSRCKTCMRAAGRAGFYRNQEKQRDRAREWNRANPERARANAVRWKTNNPDRYRYVLRRRDLMRRFGITPEQYDAMLAEQNEVCAACKQPEKALAKNGQVQVLAVDHCHATGRVRGLLCAACNMTLGHHGDDPDRLDALAAYLRRSQQPF